MPKWSIESNFKTENLDKTLPQKSFLIKNSCESPIIAKIEVLEYLNINLPRIIITASNELSFDKMLRSIGKQGFTKFELDYVDKEYKRFVYDCANKDELSRLLHAVCRIDFIEPILMLKIKKILGIEISFPTLKEVTAGYIKMHKENFSDKALSAITIDLHELVEHRLNFNIHDEKHQEDTMPEITYTCKYF